MPYDVLRYVGNGEFLNGAPARDITPEVFAGMDYETQAAVLMSNLYVSDNPPAVVEAAPVAEVEPEAVPEVPPDVPPASPPAPQAAVSAPEPSAAPPGVSAPAAA